MSEQQVPMFNRPSGPKPRTYKWLGMWVADVRPGTPETFKCTFHKSHTEAITKAVEYAKERQDS